MTTLNLIGGTFEPRVRVGQFLLPDQWPIGNTLDPCTDWDRAEFRIRSHTNPEFHIACNVVPSGYKVRYSPYSRLHGTLEGAWLRVAIIFPGDGGEPDVETGGWVKFNECELVEVFE